MALSISKTAEKKLTIQGTSIELDSIYSRLEFALFKGGSKMQGALYNYQTKDLFDSGSPILKIEDLENIFNFDIDVAEGEQQSLQVGHQKVKEILELKGYSVEIVGL